MSLWELCHVLLQIACFEEFIFYVLIILALVALWTERQNICRKWTKTLRNTFLTYRLCSARLHSKFQCRFKKWSGLCLDWIRLNAPLESMNCLIPLMKLETLAAMSSVTTKHSHIFMGSMQHVYLTIISLVFLLAWTNLCAEIGKVNCPVLFLLYDDRNLICYLLHGTFWSIS